MSRWKFKQETVVVGDNTLVVRALTHGERLDLTKKFTEAKEATSDSQAVQALVIAAGSVEPKLTLQDVAEMPPDLADAASTKILELTGLSGKKEVPAAS